MSVTSEGDVIALVDWIPIGRDLDVRRVLHQEPDRGRLGQRVGQVLGLAGQVRVVVLLLGRQLQHGDGRLPLCVLHGLDCLGDALIDSGAVSIEPIDLKIHSRLKNDPAVHVVLPSS